MKTRIVFSVMLVLALAFFLFIKPNAKENNVQLAPGFDTTFRVGAWDNGWVKDDYTNIKELGLNIWHKYSEIDSGWQRNIGIQGDIRESTDGGAYTSNVRAKIDMNSSNGFVSILDRSKISYLGLAKRSVYECEETLQDLDYWFYGYNIHDMTVSQDTIDNSSFGNGVKVRHSSPSSGHTQGYVVKGLMANREQLWMRESQLRQLPIFVLPRIRIDTTGYYYLDTTRVCKIDILKSDSSIAKSIILRKSNFAVNSTSYNGQYINQFYDFDSLKTIPITIDSVGVLNVNGYWINNDNQDCKVDYRVWWYGQCEMWLDNITVENDIAYNFFHDNPDTMRYHTFQTWLDWEVQNIAVPEEQKIFNFHFDEPEFCSLPALAKINREIKRRPGGANIRLVPNISYYLFKAHIPDFNNYEIAPNKMKKYLFDSLDIAFFNFDNYPFDGSKNYYTGIPVSKVPTTLTTQPYNEMRGFLADTVSPTVYENWLQNTLDGNSPVKFTGIMQYSNSLGKSYGINFIPVIQAHLNYANDGRLKEPSNEEISMMTNLAISYGAKGIEYFAYIGYGYLPVPSGNTPEYCRGFVNLNNAKRDSNVYGQPKWEDSKKLIHKINSWGPILIRLPIANTNSYIYSNQTERAALNNNSYFWQFITLKPGTGNITCYDNPNFPQGYIPDCQSEIYLQISTFGGIEPNSQYFMVVNRRCSPYINENSEDNRGGKRQILSYFHSNNSAFSDFNNWSVVNCENDSVVASFNKSNPGYVNLDWFMPGEGKLYKIVPMMSTGGTLVCNEDFNSDVICKKNIYNNGFNITIGTNANVSFADSVGIYMSGGNLTIGSINDNPTSGHLQFKGITSNNKWQGFVLDSCGVVQVYGGYFSNIMQNQSAFNVSNCFHYRFENNQFTCAQGENSNGININYNLTSFEDEIENAYHYIRNNNFNFTGNSNYAINITATGSASIPVLIESNTLNTNYGIFVENISGGAINQNSISNYSDGITLLSSSCDFYQNTLTSSETDATGIKLLLSTSVIAPTSSNGYFVGGLNNLSSLGSNSSNIKVEDSYFNIDNGYNEFNIDFEYSQRHITGYFPSNSESEYKAGYNCFKNNSVVDTASIYVTQGSGEEASRITFNTDPTYCGTQEFANYEVFNLAGNINDTIYYRSGGTGGGYKEGQAMAVQTQTTYKLLKDSISLNLRKHFYNLTELECREMLLNYPDSSESIGMVSKLYLSSLSLDSAGNHIQNTKTFFENLILNNPNNTPLIKRANYFVQKCKVALKQFTSALQGFQEIINQNPYSYEGLIASWDYAATQLLANSGGSFSDEEVKSNEEESEINSYNNNFILDSLRNKKSTTSSYTTGNYDTKKFTKQDRESINSNVTNAFKNERTKQIEKIQELEKKITTLSNSNSKTKPKTKSDELVLSNAKKELKTMKVLSEVVKVKKPKNVNEHIKIINADIKKVFTIEKTSGSGKTNNLIPLDYNLSQNYPNPFNPNTKINYELPKDGKVRLVIYDILGRQIKSLVNNEFKTAGRYTVEFNGTQYASGVYFYRIQVEDGKGFTAVKKMVLVK